MRGAKTLFEALREQGFNVRRLPDGGVQVNEWTFPWHSWPEFEAEYAESPAQAMARIYEILRMPPVELPPEFKGV